MSESNGLTGALQALREILDLGQAALTEAFEKDEDVPRFKVMGLCDVANMALLKYDPSRQEELKALRTWATKRARGLGLETLAEAIRVLPLEEETRD